ncbi:hypothetical protein T439DRAFT_383263 [Meredithblackwellia eburnea MCA 4105]
MSITSRDYNTRAAGEEREGRTAKKPRLDSNLDDGWEDYLIGEGENDDVWSEELGPELSLGFGIHTAGGGREKGGSEHGRVLAVGGLGFGTSKPTLQHHPQQKQSLKQSPQTSTSSSLTQIGPPPPPIDPKKDRPVLVARTTLGNLNTGINNTNSGKTLNLHQPRTILTQTQARFSTPFLNQSSDLGTLKDVKNGQPPSSPLFLLPASTKHWQPKPGKINLVPSIYTKKISHKMREEVVVHFFKHLWRGLVEGKGEGERVWREAGCRRGVEMDDEDKAQILHRTSVQLESDMFFLSLTAEGYRSIFARVSGEMRGVYDGGRRAEGRGSVREILKCVVRDMRVERREEERERRRREEDEE